MSKHKLIKTTKSFNKKEGRYYQNHHYKVIDGHRITKLVASYPLPKDANEEKEFKEQIKQTYIEMFDLVFPGNEITEFKKVIRTIKEGNKKELEATMIPLSQKKDDFPKYLLKIIKKELLQRKTKKKRNIEKEIEKGTAELISWIMKKKME